MRAALVSNGVVDNVIRLPDDWTGAPSEWQPPASAVIVPSLTANVGDTYDGAVFSGAAREATEAAEQVVSNQQARGSAIDAIATDRSVSLKLSRAVVELVKDEINLLLAVVPRLISSITRSGTVATVTTPTAHGLSTSATVVIIGADVAAYNGLKTITVTSPTVFTYPGVGASATPATGSLLYVLSANTPPLARTMAQAVSAVKAKITSGVVD